MDKVFGVETAEESPGFLLWQVTTLWQRGIKKALEAVDITHPQFVLLASLMWLSQQQETVTQVALSQHSKIDPMTTSTVLRTLQTKGLVGRSEHHTDTRAKAVVLTAAGIKTTKQAVKIIEHFDTEFFSTLGSKTPTFNKLLLTLLG